MSKPLPEVQHAEVSAIDSIFERECEDIVSSYNSLEPFSEMSRRITIAPQVGLTFRADYQDTRGVRVRVICWRESSGQKLVEFHFTYGLKPL